jgi:hypothetical protein
VSESGEDGGFFFNAHGRRSHWPARSTFQCQAGAAGFEVCCCDFNSRCQEDMEDPSGMDSVHKIRVMTFRSSRKRRRDDEASCTLWILESTRRRLPTSASWPGPTFHWRFLHLPYLLEVLGQRPLMPLTLPLISCIDLPPWEAVNRRIVIWALALALRP